MIPPKAKTHGRRKLQIYDDTVGPRCRPSCRNRLRTDIMAKGGYDYVYDVLKPPASHNLFFKLGYLKGIREKKLQQMAGFLRPGEDPNYYIEEEVTRKSCFNIPIDRVRRLIEYKIVVGEVEPYSPASGEEETSIFEMAEVLLEQMKDYGYPVSASLADEVAGDLIRDGFCVRDPESGILRVASLSLHKVEETNWGRLGFERAYHEQAIKRIHSGDREYHERITRGLSAALADCDRLLGKGKQFSKADRAWHMVVIPNGCRILIEPLMKACERPYMMKRRLSKSLYGAGHANYVDLIKRFNRKQYDTLKLITDEYRNAKPIASVIYKRLKEHTELQIKAWHDCEELKEVIAERGEEPKLGD